MITEFIKYNQNEYVLLFNKPHYGFLAGTNDDVKKIISNFLKENIGKIVDIKHNVLDKIIVEYIVDDEKVLEKYYDTYIYNFGSTGNIMRISVSPEEIKYSGKSPEDVKMQIQTDKYNI